MIRSLCVFCGANHGRRPAYRAAAQQVGELLAARNITLVYGGGNVGLMGTLADAGMNKGADIESGWLGNCGMGFWGQNSIRAQALFQWRTVVYNM